MSKVLKIHTIPEAVGTMGTDDNESDNMLEEMLKLDAFKDWLEPFPEDQYKARCTVCNVILDCNRHEVTKHATSSGHQATLQNIRKRKSAASVIGQLGLLGNVTMANASSSGGGPPRKIILLRRNMIPNVKCEVVRENISENSEGDIGIKVISPQEKAVHMNDFQLAQQRKRKTFRLEWLDIPEFKDWLSPDPDSPYKARCLACNTILNAGKSELEKHATGAKHEKSVEALKQMVLEQQEWDEAQDMEEEEDEVEMYDTTSDIGTQTDIIGDEVSTNAERERSEQLELMHRIATSVETLASSTANTLETLTKNQETLTHILMELTKK